MGGLAPQAALDRGIEATLRRDHRLVTASLVLVVALAWLYLWHTATTMGLMDMRDMAMPGMQRAFDAGSLTLTFFMWCVMMIGMMLPGASPTVLLYGALARKNGERGNVLPGVWVFASGYLAVWTGFSLLAALLQGSLERAALVTPTIASASTYMSAALLLAAGLYQWLPFKDACLRQCRNPLQFLLARWRPGASGAFRMGAQSGGYCLGCCWVLMLLLFVVGVMNLLWVALIAAFVFAEKLVPGRLVSGIAGTGLILTGVVLLIGP